MKKEKTKITEKRIVSIPTKAMYAPWKHIFLSKTLKRQTYNISGVAIFC
jgi:hypothetical protein